MDLAFALGMGFLVAIETLYMEVKFNGAPYAPRSMNMYSQPRVAIVSRPRKFEFLVPYQGRLAPPPVAPV